MYLQRMLHVAMLFSHCRHPTVPTCGGSGPCLSGGELSGVCCQRQVHVLCVRVSMQFSGFLFSYNRCCIHEVNIRMEDFSTFVYAWV